MAATKPITTGPEILRALVEHLPLPDRDPEMER
jgi:hypothetical protein